MRGSSNSPVRCSAHRPPGWNGSLWAFPRAPHPAITRSARRAGTGHRAPTQTTLYVIDPASNLACLLNTRELASHSIDATALNRSFSRCCLAGLAHRDLVGARVVGLVVVPLDGIVLGVEPSAPASCRGGRCGRRPGRTSTTWVLRLPANSRDPSRAFSPASGLALGGGSEREVAGSEEPVLGDHAVTGGPDIRDVGAHLPLGDDVSLVPSSAPASAGSGCHGIPRPTRDAVSREALRLAVGSAGADLVAVRRSWFPSWIASTWVLHDTSTPCFWSSARTKAPRSGSTVGSISSICST